MADAIKLPVADVESKLSQMILDRKFAGTLDHSKGGILEIYEEEAGDELYGNALGTVDNVSKVLDSLMGRSLKIVS